MFFYFLSEHWTDASWRANTGIRVCHQWETSAEHTEKQQQEQSSVLQEGQLFPLVETQLSADSGLPLSFAIMILSRAHKHTSLECVLCCAWNHFHLCFICFLKILVFLLFNYMVTSVCHIKHKSFTMTKHKPEVKISVNNSLIQFFIRRKQIPNHIGNGH